MQSHGTGKSQGSVGRAPASSWPSSDPPSRDKRLHWLNSASWTVKTNLGYATEEADRSSLERLSQRNDWESDRTCKVSEENANILRNYKTSTGSPEIVYSLLLLVSNTNQYIQTTHLNIQELHSNPHPQPAKTQRTWRLPKRSITPGEESTQAEMAPRWETPTSKF